jgi:hypothetical protein
VGRAPVVLPESFPKEMTQRKGWRPE